MKTLYTILCVAVIAFSINAQECENELSMFNESVKAKIYDDALPRYANLIENCPDISIALYVRADKMFEDLAKTASDEAESDDFIQQKIDNLKLRLENMPQKSPIGAIYSAIGETMYNHNVGTINERFKYFEEAWIKDSDNFKSPKAIYAYFRVYNTLEEQGDKQLNDLFAKYDELVNHIEKMKDEQALISKTCLDKTDSGEKLSIKESKTCKNAKIYLRNYELIIKGMNKIISDKADCENIIPIYNREFEDRKDNKTWLKIAAARMNAEDCTSDPLFIKLVDALNTLEPSSNTLKYLGKLAYKNGDYTKAINYFQQALDLEQDNQKKAKLNFLIAETYKDKNAYSSAKKYYTKALDQKPSLGIAYLRIAKMIADSANDCGKTTFEKRAVYWIAEKYARRAAAVDEGIKKTALVTAESYKQRAPSTSDIFQEDKAGKTIVIECWLKDSVVVPNITKK